MNIEIWKPRLDDRTACMQKMDLVTRCEQGVLTAKMAIAASQRGRRDDEYCVFFFLVFYLVYY